MVTHGDSFRPAPPASFGGGPSIKSGSGQFLQKPSAYL
jgi:hypothetical protein